MNESIDNVNPPNPTSQLLTNPSQNQLPSDQVISRPRIHCIRQPLSIHSIKEGSNTLILIKKLFIIHIL